MKINRINIVYFSPTGTSRKVATAIAKGFEDLNASIFDATKSPISLKATKDSLTIVAMPVYGGHLPITARERINELTSEGSPAISVVVYGNRAYEHALEELAQTLQDKGFKIAAGATFIGEHSYSTGNMPIAQGRPDKNDLEEAKKFGKMVADKLAKNKDVDEAIINVSKIKKSKQPFFPLLRFIFSVLKLRRNAIPMPTSPQTDAQLCSHCGACAKVCPVGAIKAGNEEKTDAQKCIRCCACVKVCPHKARTFNTPFAELLYRNFKYQKKNQYIL